MKIDPKTILPPDGAFTEASSPQLTLETSEKGAVRPGSPKPAETHRRYSQMALHLTTRACWLDRRWTRKH